MSAGADQLQVWCSILETGNPLITGHQAFSIRAASRDWPSVTVFAEPMGMLELMMRGALGEHPAFMTSTEYESVRAFGQLPDGVPWLTPVLLPIPEKVACRLRPGSALALRDREGVMLAAMQVNEIWTPAGGGVQGPGGCRCIYLAGPVTGIQFPTFYSFEQYRSTAQDLRSQLAPPEGPDLIGFIAAEPIHRPLFDALTATARDTGSRVLIIGALPPTADIGDAHSVIRCWLHAVQQSLGLMHLSLWPIPHSPEGVFLAAEVAKSVGCRLTFTQHGLKSSCCPNRSFTWLETDHRLPPELPDAEAAEPAHAQVVELLRNGIPVPESLTFSAVARELSSVHPPPLEQGLTLFFTGLSGSGKSTIANALRETLMARSGRQVTLLDGDVVRQHLSGELGFSREDRETNVMRIAYVAAEITRHRGIAICAPIAPYEELRARARATIQAHGIFVLVYVSTPLEVCEQRDCKGLYAKARCGLIENFTGISDVYEEPASADIVIETSGSTPRDAVELITSWLESRGYLAKCPAVPIDGIPRRAF